MQPEAVKVLVVDDDEDDYVLTKAAFEDIASPPHRVEWAASYEEGERRIMEGRHDVYFIDYRLGEKTGLELLRAVIQRGCRKPLIILTGQGDHEVDVEAMRAGAAEYLLKADISAVVLERAVRYAISHFHTLDELREAKEKAEEAVRLEIRYTELFNVISDGLVLHEFNPASKTMGTFVEVNDAMSRRLGYSREEMLRMTPDDIDAGETVTKPEEYEWLERENRERGSVRFERVHRAKDGRLIPVEINSRQFPLGGKTMALSVVRDITERKEAERQLNKAKEAAEEATLLKDKFVLLVSHDLKNPLAGLHGYLNLAQEEAAKAGLADMEKFIGISLGYVQKMFELISDLLDAGRFLTGKIKPRIVPVEISNMILAEVEAFAPMALSKGVALTTAIPENTVMHADAILLREVLRNLISNAIKFCRKGDTVNIFLPGGKPDTIAVADTGIGIPSALLKNILKYEEKTSRAGTAGETGTGFGLPLSHDIMKAHGGGLRVESETGKGSTFYIILPPRMNAPA